MAECPLPLSVENLITIICKEQSQPPPDIHARRELASLGEEQSRVILEKIRKCKITKSFSGFIVFMSKQARNTTVMATQLGSFSPDLRSLTPISPPHSEESNYLSDSGDSAASGSSVSSGGAASVVSFLSDKLASIKLKSLNLFGLSKLHKPSREFMALEKLGFQRTFLVLSYIGGKIEDVASVREIKKLVAESEKLTMGSFENLVWNRYGDQYCLLKDRIKYSTWGSPGQHYFYHCRVQCDGSYCFKVTSLLQKIFKEENVLIVKFVNEEKGKSKLSRGPSSSFAAYERIAREGIYFGQKSYQFFAFKDGRRGEKDNITSSVKCYFVNMDTFAPLYDIHRCPRQARSVFMHLDTLPSLSKYAARLELILSKTITLPMNLDALNIEVLADIKCQLADGSDVMGEDGKALIHTDGTGYISEDLVRGFPWNDFNKLSDHSFERYHVDGLELNELPTQSPELPLLLQFRLFYKGYAVKGTVLVNRKIPQRTIQVRPSMIKVCKDPEHIQSHSVNSFEVVATSGRPKKSYLSRYLVSLLHYGGVPEEFFIGILRNAIDDAQASLTNKRAALQVALESGDMDDERLIARMILCGIPLHEPYLKTRLNFLTAHQNKSLKGGKLPIGESFYLMGTADPTSTLQSGEVCIIHENGQISGKVLVYRNPGIHFGDIHVLTARHVEGLEEIVGNSKYGIFFPIKGSRSLTDAMAGGDLDGDMYWVSRNLDLLKYFKPSEPWIGTNNSSSSHQKIPKELSDEELEHELFSHFLSTRSQSSKAMGIASNNWLVHMDQLLTLEDKYIKKRECLKEKMLKLVDIYYDALDAPKTGVTVNVPRELTVETYPHYMEKTSLPSYHSESILGKIYDEAHKWEVETPPIPVWKLSLLNVEVPETNLKTWHHLYKKYRADMTSASNIVDLEQRRENQNKVVLKYKKILYEATDFEKCSREWEAICFDALAIYNVSYDYAKRIDDAKKCGFAWRVAGEALLKILNEGQAEKPLVCLPSVLQEILTRKTVDEKM
ncbi:probable RNA-dependent RNA polymerase 5 isoform X2 [Amaranthus tricolor]|uniref:probable RNA-dependent RNA polymerase 5 isoform X2 n=1 Tax=Amaranthus tricolor TaxID=29722 RepID=UPI002587CDEC|nr:probable RNA-dependent RNA polymerase 5 isoform X2 [Amaranthus tricolor]